MRFLTAALLAAVASPAVAGPLDTLQYRTTLCTDRPTTTGPAQQPWETAYLLADSPAFGVIVGNSSGWGGAGPAYPGASFAVIGAGGLVPFTAAEGVDGLELEGGGRYTLDVEFRDAAGRAGGVSFSGPFSAGWWWGHGWGYPDFDSPGPRGSFWLGPTRYDVQLGYGGPPSYRQNEDGSWDEVRFPADSVPFREGGYWTEGSGSFYATVTPAQTPEPGTLALAGIGLCVASAARRRR